MGVVDCERHGRRSFVVVCEHVRTQIEANETPVGHRGHTVPRTMVCADCFTSRGFDQIAKLPGPPEFSNSDPHGWSREMLNEFDEWAARMWDASGDSVEALENKGFACIECFEALDPKDLSRWPG